MAQPVAGFPGRLDSASARREEVRSVCLLCAIEESCVVGRSAEGGTEVGGDTVGGLSAGGRYKVPQEEVVDHARLPAQRRTHVGVLEPLCVRLALIAERIVFTGDHDRRGQPTQIWSEQGADTRIASHRQVGHPLSVEPLDVGHLEAIPVAFGLDGRPELVRSVFAYSSTCRPGAAAGSSSRARRQARVAVVPPALSPATATAVGCGSSTAGRVATQRSAASASSTAAGHGCSGALR